jgi:hypothetical protein
MTWHGGGLATYLINLGNHVSIVDILIFESNIFYYVKTFGIVFSHLYFDNLSN